ncbi:MAG TPA: DsrE family protein [Gaiellaceae bacterium]|nr:DsrE family protein [Gaiellaceae bacterium]
MTVQAPERKEPTRTGVSPAKRTVDVRGLTITTAIVSAVGDALTELQTNDELDVLTDRFPAIVPDLEAWCRASGHQYVGLEEEGESWRIGLRKGAPRRNDQRVAVVVSDDGLEELLSPLGFALAAAQGGANVALFIQGPAVHVLAPAFQARLSGFARPFSRFARRGMEKTGHVAPTEKLRQLQALGARLYACGPSLEHFKVDATRLAFEDVVVCEYLTFMEVMQQADVQLYA